MNIKFPSPPDTGISNEEYNAIFKSCSHVDVKLRWRTASKQSIWQQCLCCGDAVGKAIKHSTLSCSELSRLEIWDETIEAELHEFKTQAYESKKQEKDALWRAWYNSYLNSPAWKMKRDAALKRDHYHCQGCLEKSATQVHHLTYRHVGNELLFELASVCNECHAAAHPDKNEFPNAA